MIKVRYHCELEGFAFDVIGGTIVAGSAREAAARLEAAIEEALSFQQHPKPAAPTASQPATPQPTAQPAPQPSEPSAPQPRETGKHKLLTDPDEQRQWIKKIGLSKPHLQPQIARKILELGYPRLRDVPDEKIGEVYNFLVGIAEQ